MSSNTCPHCQVEGRDGADDIVSMELHRNAQVAMEEEVLGG
jgi:hypothetical protein